jgi:hypothetical protein
MESNAQTSKTPSNAWIIIKFTLKVIGMVILAGLMVYPSILYGQYFLIGR